MMLTPKESTLLKDLKSQEQLCVEKYTKYSQEATDPQLRSLFAQIAQVEMGHMNTLDSIAAGNVPSMSGGQGGQQNSQQSNMGSSTSSAADKQKDQFLCHDALSTEKYVSADYNTCIFEFRDKNIREALNHIQKEEQQHGEQIYNYMAQNGMYQ